MRFVRQLPTLSACAAALVIAGCGGSATATAPRTPRPHHVTPTPTVQQATAAVDTPTPLAAPTVTATVAPPTPTSTVSLPTSTPPPKVAAAPQVVSASLSPTSLAAGATLHASVQISGRARAIELYLASGPGGGAPETFTLANIGSGLWGASGSAPATPGSYHFSIGLYDLAGRRTVSDNDSWNITVTGTSPTQVSSGPQALPANVPLSPPFSYGSPQVAVFSAEGQTVNGSEVVSNSRPDITASVVADWYESHFPRAGWTVDESTVPGPGATSFSIVATSGGNQVCVASYSAGVVQVFYGSLSG